MGTLVIRPGWPVNRGPEVLARAIKARQEEVLVSVGRGSGLIQRKLRTPQPPLRADTNFNPVTEKNIWK